MKKIVAVLLAAVLALAACSALAAGDFPLRDGIRFGDTLDDINRKITLTLEDGSKGKTNKVWYTGDIAGIHGEARFDFDESTGELTDMLYTFETKEQLPPTQSEYNLLREGLIRKYGEPLNNPDGKRHEVTGTAFEHAETLIRLWTQMLSGGGEILNYEEWIVEADGYSVKIDLVCYHYRNSGDTLYYSNDISYHCFVPGSGADPFELMERDL